MNQQYPSSTLLSHKRERSSGMDEDLISDMGSFLPATTTMFEGEARYGSDRDRGQGSTGVRSGEGGGGWERRDQDGREGLLTPQSATFPSPAQPGSSPSHTTSPHQHSFPSPSFDHRRNPSRSASNPTPRGPNPSLTLSLAHYVPLGTAESESGYSAGEYDFANSSPQPPSLSPMTISTPGFGSGSIGYGSAGSANGSGTPITPISPYQFSHSPTVGAGGFEEAQNEYAQSSGYEGMHQQQLYSPSSQSSHYVPHPSDPNQHSRTRLKRSHSENPLVSSSQQHSPTTPSFASPSDVYTSTYPYGPRMDLRYPFIGPPTELEAAANAAHVAAAKTGAGGGAFVYKVYHMLLDDSSQHLIAFNASGTTFTVSNTTAFAKEVLPKHFKHSNFSSFVRQLNMYGFHKVNKTPRGQSNRAFAPETLGWEFTHPKFVRGKPDQLDDIKRKGPDPEPATAAKMTRSMSANTDSLRTGQGSFAAGPSLVSFAGASIGRGRQAAPIPLSGSTIPHLPHPPPHSPTTSPPSSHLPHDSPHTHSAPQPSQPHARHHSEVAAGARAYPTQSLPLASRIEVLEMQRHELATALSGTQDGYEALYRELVETRRRQDVLINLVGEMHGVLQRTEGAQLPYQFPSHLFSPRQLDAEYPSISVTSAESRHHRVPSLHYPHSMPFDPSQGMFSFDPPAPPHSYRPDVSPLYEPQRVQDPHDLLNLLSYGHSTLAPPPSPGATFSTALNTPLPASPNPLLKLSDVAAHSLVGLGLAHEGSDERAYFAAMGMREEGEMDLSSSFGEGRRSSGSSGSSRSRKGRYGGRRTGRASSSEYVEGRREERSAVA